MTTRDRNVLIGLAMGALIAAFWFLALSPRRHEAADVRAKVEAAQEQRDTAAQQMAAATAAAREHQTDQAVIAELGKALPADDDTASLLFQLQDAAGRSHVVMQSIAPSGTNGAPVGNAAAAGTPAAPGATPGPVGVSSLGLTLTFAGTYRDLQRFIRRVQDFTSVHGDRIEVKGRLMSIDGFKLDTTQVGKALKIQASITATAYIAAADATGAAAPGTAAAGTTASAPPTATTPTGTTPVAPTASAPAASVPATVVGAGS
jgi:Tfp pilus assembly protein PilO